MAVIDAAVEQPLAPQSTSATIASRLREGVRMVGQAWRWKRAGLAQFQAVTCRVTAHRGRFGVDVEIVDPVTRVAAFIDFVLLSEAGPWHSIPSGFPEVGSMIEAVTIDFMPDGELRLSARPSDVARVRPES
jgi:hypothetical protein